VCPREVNTVDPRGRSGETLEHGREMALVCEAYSGSDLRDWVVSGAQHDRGRRLAPPAVSGGLCGRFGALYSAGPCPSYCSR
jgi:hypothetical protein